MPERARAAESLMNDVVEACKGAIAEVFHHNESAVGADQETLGQGLAGSGNVDGMDASAPAWKPTGADAVLQDYLVERTKPQDAPLISSLEKLALLG